MGSFPPLTYVEPTGEVQTLRVDDATRTLTLQYISDGLGADTDWEAFAIASRVPCSAVQPAPPTVHRLLQSAECSWMRRSQQLLERIRSMGVDAYLMEEEHGL